MDSDGRNRTPIRSRRLGVRPGRPGGALRAVALLTIAMALSSSRAAQAQLRGDYIPGFTGLQNGTQPPPGMSLGMPIYVYPTDSIKNDDGDSLPFHPNITTSFIGLAAAWVTNLQILGANYGASLTPVSLMKSRIESASLDVPGAFAFSDIFIQPLQLGWHTKRADYTI